MSGKLPAEKKENGKGDGWEKRTLRRLTEDTVENFIFIEKPGGTVDSSYARLVSTLAQPEYANDPEAKDLQGMAIEVDSDGLDHYTRFHDIQARLKRYGGEANGYPYLRDVQIIDNKETQAALAIFHKILKRLGKGYAAEAQGDQQVAEKQIRKSRELMLEFYAAAESAAQKGYGIPFWTHD